MQRFAFYGGLFLVTAVTLMQQLVQTRILSVVAWYYLAFFVISIAMFGLTAGAVWVYLRGARFTEATLSHDLTYYTGAFALTTALALLVQMTLPPVTTMTFTALLIWAELAVCLAVPFFFSGVVVSLALTRSLYPIGIVYGVDLAGAALGCLGALLLLNTVDGLTAVLWLSAALALAAVLFSASGIGTAPAARPPLAAVFRRPLVLCLVLAVCALANGLVAPHGVHPPFVKGKKEKLQHRLFTNWNSFSRIAVAKTEHRPPTLWGPSPKFEPDQWVVDQHPMNIDGLAATTAYGVHGDADKAGFLKYDITNLAYALPGQDQGAVIGVGGGRDILSARLFGVSDITGVELNPVFIHLLTDKPGFSDFVGIKNMDGISLNNAEARSWFERTDKTFDVIQMSLVDTWAATGAGAFSLSENGLYTVQGWRAFMSRLNDDGVFTVSRWYAPDNISETGRLVSLAMATAFSLGADHPRRHIFLASTGHIATLVLSRKPFSAAAIDTLEHTADKLDYQVLITPRHKPEQTTLRHIVSAGSRAELDQYTASQTLDFTPPTDERPFFFNQLPLNHPLQTLKLAGTNDKTGVVSGNLYATATLLVLFLLSVALVLAAIIIPLRPAVRHVGRRLAWGGTTYFLLIGVGFMSTEMGLLQRMGVFLGHPIYSLAIVLFSIILTTGIGSLVSDRWPLNSRPRLVVWALATGAYLLLLPAWLSPVLLAYDNLSLLGRAAICVLTIAPAGLLMGFAFPTGMRLIASVDRRPTPWFWGINGAAGVLASSLAVLCSIAFGIYTTLVIGGLCYLLLIPAALTLGRRVTDPQAPSHRAPAASEQGSMAMRSGAAAADPGANTSY